MRRSLLWPAAVALALTFLGCGDRRPAGTITLFMSAHAPSSGAVGTGDSLVVSVAGDSVIIRRAEIVLKEIQLAPTESGECEPDEEEHCAMLQVEPALIALPLGDRAERVSTVPASPRTYIGYHFAIHPPDADHDGPFLASHPEFASTSIRVTGSFRRRGKGHDFVYLSDFSERQEGPLQPPLTVSPGATVSVTLRLNVAGWFLNADQTALIDPATANRGQPNETLVRDNIRRSVGFDEDAPHGANESDGAKEPDGRSGQTETAIAPPSVPPTPARTSSPWPAHQESSMLTTLLARAPGGAPRCRERTPPLTPDSIGPFRLAQTLSELQQKCPQLLYGWQLDPDGFPVPAVVTRLGAATLTALFTDTLPSSTVRQVDVTNGSAQTAAGVGLGSTLRELQQAYGAPGASEPGCELRVWFAALPGLAFRMAFPPRERRDCGGLSEEPLPPDLRVAGVVLVPR